MPQRLESVRFAVPQPDLSGQGTGPDNIKRDFHARDGFVLELTDIPTIRVSRPSNTIKRPFHVAMGQVERFVVDETPRERVKPEPRSHA